MKFFKKKRSSLLICVLLLAIATVGTALAFVFMNTAAIQNSFGPSAVACAVIENNGKPITGADFDTGSVKERVQIKNTGTTDAYVRVAVVVNWKSDSGSVWAQKPVEGADGDYSISTDLANGWVRGGDGYYYYTKAVMPDEMTNVLINTAQLNEGRTAPQGYYLSIEIVASAIQASPDEVVEEQWGGDNAGVTLNANNGTLTVSDK